MAGLNVVFLRKMLGKGKKLFEGRKIWLLFIVFLMIIVYVLFLSWYERKYGAGGEDEE